MAVLSVDLACRRWSDLGVVILNRVPSQSPAAPGSIVECEIIAFSATAMGPEGHGPTIDCGSADAGNNAEIDAEVLAGRLNHLCAIRGIRVLMLDGPQAWKSQGNCLEHARGCERQLNTAAKTGLPGMVKPRTYRPFAEFCMDVYDALCRRGWRRLDTRRQPAQFDKPDSSAERILVESYPHAAWKSLGLKPLPAKRRARVSDLAEAYGALRALIPFTTNRPPNHDQLQAIVGGLPGLVSGRAQPCPRAHCRQSAAPRGRSLARRLHRPAGPATHLPGACAGCTRTIAFSESQKSEATILKSTRPTGSGDLTRR